MSTELRRLLDDALPPAPPLDDARFAALAHRGRSARRRRTATTVAGFAAVALALGSVVPALVAHINSGELDQDRWSIAFTEYFDDARQPRLPRRLKLAILTRILCN